jgi:hypothetical protein
MPQDVRQICALTQISLSKMYRRSQISALYLLEGVRSLVFRGKYKRHRKPVLANTVNPDLIGVFVFDSH